MTCKASHLGHVSREGKGQHSLPVTVGRIASSGIWSGDTQHLCRLLPLGEQTLWAQAEVLRPAQGNMLLLWLLPLLLGTRLDTDMCFGGEPM